MREIIDILLQESVGLANRIPGQKFVQPDTGETITFQSLIFFPDSGRFNSADELNSAINKLYHAQQIQWTNRPAASYGGFGIAHFKDDATGEDIYAGRFFKEISPNPTENNFPNNAVPGGYKYQARAAEKERTGYKPSDILTQFENNTPESILDQVVAKFGADSAIAQAAKIFIEADSLPVVIPRGDINFASFRDYFCELLQPVALIKGMEIAGNADEAEQIFFGDNGFDTCTVSFNTGAIGGLSDSVLRNSQGREIKLSSKGAKGAKASAVNLLNSVRELEETPQGQELLRKYENVIGILNIIKDQGHFLAPLQLAAMYGIIDTNDIPYVEKLKKLGPNDQIIGAGILTPKLEELYSSRKSTSPEKIVPREHLTAAIAYKVADYINKNTDFGQAASEILNNGALVQMYTDAVEKDDTIIIKGFRTVYPSKAVTGVELDASKTYFSTGGKGNYVFDILYNGATAKTIKDQEQEQAASQERQEKLAQKISNIDRPMQGLRPKRAEIPMASRDETTREKR